ncbi:MAG: hypothetical protein CMH28_08490 [Micavibrio sp.]|nr:hypothetical protein [Micavibrio sp.]|tara:strand:+ start:562 stop:1587 length:1026 start_codon:yes stop_codon:yes gene_type:complete
MAGNDFDDPDGFFDRVLKSSSGQSQFWARRSFWGGILMAVSVVALIAVIWLSYVNAPDAVPENELPLIQADTEPFREAPEEPGGMEIRNADSTIYGAMQGEDIEDDTPRVETLFEEDTTPDRETVLEEAGMADAQPPRDDELMDDIEDLIAESQIDTNSTNETEAEVAESTTSSNSDENPEDTLNYVRSVLDKKDINTQSQLAAEESASSNEVEATASASTEETTSAAQTAPLPPETSSTPEPVPAPARAPASLDAGTGPDRIIQLGSFRDRASAQTQWDKMKTDFPGLLDGLSLQIEEADLGEKGVYYRSQSSVMAQSKAKSICDTITGKNPGACIVKAP